MKQRLKRLVFGLLGKDPTAVVVVSFWTGPDALVLKMIEEIRTLLPARDHYVVSIGRAPVPEGCVCVELDPSDPYLQLRLALRRKRIGLAPVLFTGAPHPLRAAAMCLAPTKILAYNRNLERHHLRPSIASWLFLRGVPLDRIFLRPSWLCPWNKNLTRVPDDAHIVDGRPLDRRRRRLAIISPYFPYPLSHGGAVRIYHLLKEAAEEFDLFLFSFAKDPPAQEYGPLMEFCAKAIVLSPPYYREPRWSTLDPPETREFQSEPMRRLLARIVEEYRIDLIQVEYTQLAPYGGDILVEHDITHDLYRQVFERAKSLSTFWDFIRWRRFETRAVRQFRRVVAMSEKDAGLLGVATTRVIENGVDMTRFQPEPERPGQRLLFVGSFNHFPNVEAFRFFHSAVWPNLRSQFPEMTLTVVAGRNHALYWRQFTAELALPSEERISVLDFVRDVRPLYVECNLVIVPTIVSAGTNLKVLEAMAMERAVVSTTCGCAGLGLEHGASVWVADDADSFAAAVAHLLENPPERARLARAAKSIVGRFDWNQLGRKQRALYRELLRSPDPAGVGHSHHN
jgi:glycosyltransferase involved in cell wall biosynthesis